MKKLIMFAMLLGVIACNKETEPLRQIQVTEIEYTVNISNKCTTDYTISSDYFTFTLSPQQSKTIKIKSTYDNIKGFYINYKSNGGTYVSQYKPVRNDDSKVFNMEIGGSIVCQ